MNELQQISLTEILLSCSDEYFSELYEICNGDPQKVLDNIFALGITTAMHESGKPCFQVILGKVFESRFTKLEHK